jgi:hypothetical protein
MDNHLRRVALEIVWSNSVEPGQTPAYLIVGIVSLVNHMTLVSSLMNFARDIPKGIGFI